MTTMNEVITDGHHEGNTKTDDHYEGSMKPHHHDERSIRPVVWCRVVRELTGEKTWKSVISV